MKIKFGIEMMYDQKIQLRRVLVISRKLLDLRGWILSMRQFITGRLSWKYILWNLKNDLTYEDKLWQIGSLWLGELAENGFCKTWKNYLIYEDKISHRDGVWPGDSGEKSFGDISKAAWPKRMKFSSEVIYYWES